LFTQILLTRFKIITAAITAAQKNSNLPIIYNDGAITAWQKPDDGSLVLEDTSIDTRVDRRIDFIERKRQSNIEAVTSAAARELASVADVADVAPDDDWVARFFTAAQDINTEQMQDLWGRILSGEIKKPGSYSLRTLDFIRNISTEEAKVFEKIGHLAFCASKQAFVWAEDKKWLESERGIRDSDHFLLAELGIMYPTDLQLSTFLSDVDETIFRFSDHLLHVLRGGIVDKIDIKIWKFTGIGLEMLALLSPKFDNEYIGKVAKIFTNRKGEVTLGVVTADFSDGRISYNIVRKYEAEVVPSQPNTAPESAPK